MNQPAKPFRTDGCSLSPDWKHRDCCEMHDRAYWQGGSWLERLAADYWFMVCVAGRYRWFIGWPLAIIKFAFVRIFGSPFLPTPWRWGFGHPYPKHK